MNTRVTFLVEKVSSHPPLSERIARLQALIGAVPGAASASGLTDDQLRAKFSESVWFVRNLASTDPEVMAKIMLSAFQTTEGARRLLQEKIVGTQIDRESTSRDSIEQKLYESNLASTGDLKPSRNPIAQKLFESILASAGDLKPNEGGDSSMSQALAADPAGVTGIGLPDSAATEALEVETLAKMLGPAMVSMRQKKAATHPAAAEHPTRARGTFLFWIVIALSAGAIVAALALK